MKTVVIVILSILLIAEFIGSLLFIIFTFVDNKNSIKLMRIGINMLAISSILAFIFIFATLIKYLIYLA